jgi:hypothetical protein
VHTPVGDKGQTSTVLVLQLDQHILVLTTQAFEYAWIHRDAQRHSFRFALTAQDLGNVSLDVHAHA